VSSTFEAAPKITAIDTMMVGQAMVTSAYLVHASEPALVETGPTTSLQAVLEGLRSIGLGPADLRHIAVTHIHLDHAGGAGALAPHFPDATVWVHERGAPHLTDPRRLVASATRIYGEEAMARMFGPVRPVPAERVRSLVGGDRIALGDRWLDVMYAPGHASHQVCFVDSDTGVLFTGDALGVFLPDVGILRPATPPPEFDLELALDSVERVRGAHPPTLLFSHFGPAREVDVLCSLAVERLRRWTELVGEAILMSTELQAVIAYLREQTADEMQPASDRGIDPGRYEVLSSVEMNAMGIMRYLQGRPGQRS
jgi:glyoxylase-like metal-dependent hydrolase (beta-lactamase superfamily II)